MATQIVDDALRSVIEPLIPVKPRRADHPGRNPIPPRQALTRIVFVPRSGVPWEMLPAEMGYGSGVTCWRR